jgi:glucose-1-phosphate thymidylyltransferase
MKLYYTYQVGEGGIADALRLAEGFVDGKFVVMLGDNIILQDMRYFAKAFEAQEGGARVLLKEVHDPQRFGVAEFAGKKIRRIVEKPTKPASPFAVTGVYAYDRSVFNVVKTLKPSGRGELEITDVNMHYALKGTLEFNILKDFWSDAGTFESLAAASLYVRDVRCNSR